MSNVQNTEAQVSGLAENVRHNEKNIDLLRIDLKEFREEVDQKFDKVDQRFEKVDEAIATNKDAIAALGTKQTIGFVVLAALVVFQDQVSSLVSLLQFAAN